VSRVVTHELCATGGHGGSQESLRFVRLDALSAYVPMPIRRARGMEVSATVSSGVVQQSLAKLFAIGTWSASRRRRSDSAFRRVAP
jgi:hypothetical protein